MHSELERPIVLPLGPLTEAAKPFDLPSIVLESLPLSVQVTGIKPTPLLAKEFAVRF